MGNLMDYGSNYAFVQHVLSMDTTFEGNALMWRAITEPWLWTVAYLAIIVAEGTFAALSIIGGIKLFLNRNADAASYPARPRLGLCSVCDGSRNLVLRLYLHR